MEPNSPLRLINSMTPIRICDNGVMTDTWFAEYGKVFNIAVSPYVEVQIKVYPCNNQEERIIISTENYGEEYVWQPKLTNWIGFDIH